MPRTVSEMNFTAIGPCSLETIGSTSLRYGLVLRLPVQPIVTRPGSLLRNRGW